MTFKDLKKRISSSGSQQQTQFIDKLRNKPFWIWNAEGHEEDIRTKGDCFFNHIIGYHRRMKMINLSMTKAIIFDSLVTQGGNDNYSSANKPSVS
jgi:hypothetical protein